MTPLLPNAGCSRVRVTAGKSSEPLCHRVPALVDCTRCLGAIYVDIQATISLARVMAAAATGWHGSLHGFGVAPNGTIDREQTHSPLGRTLASRATGDSTTITPDSSQNSAPEAPTTLPMIAIALLVSVLEAVFSTMNAIQDDAFRLTSFKDYVYSASSMMELIGLLFGLARFFRSKWDIKQLGLPLVLISTGVVEDDQESRMIGFGGTVLQAGFICLLLVVWLCLSIDWFFWVVVGISPLLCLCCKVQCVRRRARETQALPRALASGEREISLWMYLTLPFSPVVVELLESYFLLRIFSLDTLVLLVIDVLAVLPGIAWLVVQVLNISKPLATSS